ncbi:YcaO-like family protein [Hoeflea prorocentri]|uniref:YcaO-like family protein n=1 Tax=Hoeflea prorocentri TaxID=1922333 RepID=A0A9X3ULL7_9HYPH|nr:YcaO-like family protein [Hoeflea prorocentri]MCY6382852.1 YcaO-like family protein [Hoeflea prorocentri]MDA5400652.1 YcaO-like family protein [Hoeflea prorocentri]
MDLHTQDSGAKRLSEGWHRVCNAEETLARILPLKERFGITRLANVTGLDRLGVPVFLATRPNARSVAVSQGKGLQAAQAKASALMEAVEIWHAEHFDRPMRFASLRELSGNHRVIDVDRLPGVVDGRFSESLRMLWADAQDLISGENLLVPFEMVHADYTHPVQPGHGCFPASTNGLSSGNHPLEAVCHGICEVVERDGLAVWHHASIGEKALRGLEQQSIDDAPAQLIMQRFASAGLQCGLWDVTTDIGVATVLCAVMEPGHHGGHVGLGSGTHLDRRIALRRALTEAAQTRLNYISGSRDDLMMSEYDLSGRAEKNEAVIELLEASAFKRPFSALPSVVNPTLSDDLATLLGALRKAGIEEVAAVDLSRDDTQIPVVRIIVPGLEAPHDDSTYLPGSRAFQGLTNGEVVT